MKTVYVQTGLQPLDVDADSVTPSLAKAGDLFQGAPILPRMDVGDAFDRDLQRLLLGFGAEPSDDGLICSSGDASGRFYTWAEHAPVSAEALDLHYEPAPTASPAARLQPQHLTPYTQLPHSRPAAALSEACVLPQLASLSAATEMGGYQHLPFEPDVSGLHNEQQRHQAQGKAGVVARRPDLSPAERSSKTMTDHRMGNASSTLSQQSSANEVLTEISRFGALHPMPAIDADAAREAWPKRRRSAASEESKEKERARNRRAQKRFREREKERQEQRQGALLSLEAQLEAMTREKEALLERNAILEKAVALKREQRSYDAFPYKWDPAYVLEMCLGEDAEIVPRLTVSEASRTLSKEDIRGLLPADHAKIYKDYVDALRQLLSSSRNPEREARLAQLCQELCSLNLAVALQKPADFAAFQTSRLDLVGTGLASVHAPPSTWRRCVEAVQLSAAQKEALLSERRRFLDRLRPLLKQRRCLHELVTGALPAEGSASSSHTSRLEAMEAVEKLRNNLRQEQIMLVQTMCATFQQHLAPHQTAANIVAAYPYYPDVPLMVELIASEAGSEAPASSLLRETSLAPA